MTYRLDVAPRGERELVMTRIFDAPPHLVFAAHTVPALLKRWMTGPEGWSMTDCEIDLRVGGAYRYRWEHVDGRSMAAGGEFREIAPPDRIVQAERFDDDWTQGEVINTATFEAVGEQTRLTVVCLYASGEARGLAAASGMETGMEAGYANLDTLLAGEQEAAR